MKFLKIFCLLSIVFLFQCKNESGSNTDNPSNAPKGMSSVEGETVPTILKIAVSSKDHSTLATAVKAAALEDALSNPGPFTVFAPINSAFDKLPEGTVAGLLKPEKKSDLEDVLYHHVFIGVLKEEDLKEKNGQDVNMFSGGPISIQVVDGKLEIDGAKVIASVPASNGIVHIIDKVLLPKN
jgi:uncharacterized surface protein with fasciclin (FAS1) repeats